MPRFVVLEHDHPTLHWDFMLEWGTSLRTWRLDRIPAEAATLNAVALPDHRLVYLDYEGPVTRNRGSVARVASGTFEVLSGTSDSLTVRLSGELLSGVAIVTSADSGSFEWQPLVTRQ